MNFKKLICFCIGHNKVYKLTETENYMYNGYCKCCNEPLGFFHWKIISKKLNDDEKNIYETILNENRKAIIEYCDKKNQEIPEKMTFHKFTQIQKGRFILVIIPAILYFISCSITFLYKTTLLQIIALFFTVLFLSGYITVVINDYKSEK